MPAHRMVDDPNGPPATEMIVFRAPKPMAVGLKRHALAQGMDMSVLIRVLLRESAERHGFSVTTL